MRTAALAIVVLLASCRPSVAVEAADEASSPLVAQLVNEARDRGSQVVRLDRPGVTVIVDSAAIVEHNTAARSCAVGLQQGKLITLLAVGDWAPCFGLVREDGSQLEGEVRVSAAGQKLALAHELGHAGGLLDTTTGGLMTHGDHSCLHREIECLAAALDGR